MGFEDLILKTSCVAFHVHYNCIFVHYNCIFMHLVVCYTCWTACVLVGLDWAEPMILFTLHVTCSCIFMHTYLTFNIFLYIWTVWSYSDCLFLPPFSLVYVSALMAPKCKSALSQNPLRSRAYTSSSNPTPSSIRFCDEDAQKDFSKNFSRRGVHLECRVILENFANIDLPIVIHSRGWESLCDVLITCPFVLIQEFYSNMHGIDSSMPLFHTPVRGTRIIVTPELVSNVLHVLKVEHLEYLECERLRTVCFLRAPFWLGWSLVYTM